MIDPEPSDEPIDYAHLDPDRQSQFAIAVLLVLASPFLVDALANSLLRAIRGESIVAPILVGVVFTKFGLLAMWLSWGGSCAIWRMLVVMVSLLFTSFAAPIDRNNPQLFIILFLIAMICSAMIALPRLFGVRWITSWDSPFGTVVAAKRLYQFSIVDMLIWTMMTALVAGLIQWIGLPEGIDLVGFVFTLIGLAMLALGVLAAMWAELTVRPRIVGRVAAVYALAIVLALLIAGVTNAPAEAVAYILAMFLTTASCLLGALFVLRCFNHRLIRHGRKSELQRNLSGSDAPRSPFSKGN